MDVSDQELRQLVRDAIARHTGHAGESDPAHAHPRPPVPFNARAHASFTMLPLARGGDSADDGACLIEPTVRCNHCGYCLSYGH
jgi:hypothetical protein